MCKRALTPPAASQTRIHTHIFAYDCYICAQARTNNACALQLPPQDAYFKLKNVIEEVNSLIAAYTGNQVSLTLPVHLPSFSLSFENAWCCLCTRIKALTCKDATIILDMISTRIML
jgi:hypothetical protein